MKWVKRLLFLSFFVVYPVAAAPTPGACGMHVTGDLNLNFEVPRPFLASPRRAMRRIAIPAGTAADPRRYSHELRLTARHR